MTGLLPTTGCREGVQTAAKGVQRAEVAAARACAEGSRLAAQGVLTVEVDLQLPDRRTVLRTLRLSLAVVQVLSCAVRRCLRGRQECRKAGLESKQTSLTKYVSRGTCFPAFM